MTDPIPADLLEVHRRYNRNSAGLWQEFSDHRARVTRLAVEAGGETLAVLGAGNCNDLDLPALAARFRTIHLADVDEEAVRHARERQPDDVSRALVVHAPVDLSGALATTKSFAKQSPTRSQLAAFPQQSADAVVAALPVEFDTVLSACLLSQIMHGCRLALGPDHMHLPVIGDALAVAHLRAMAGLLRPGGTGLLVTDTVSAKTAPELARWEAGSGMDLLARLQKEDRLLSGTAPGPLLHALTADRVLAPLLGPPQVVEPWLWTLGPMTLMVYALVFKRRFLYDIVWRASFRNLTAPGRDGTVPGLPRSLGRDFTPEEPWGFQRSQRPR